MPRMSRTDASILRQRQVRMYRAAHSFLALRVFVATYAILVLAWGAAYAIALAVEQWGNPLRITRNSVLYLMAYFDDSQPSLFDLFLAFNLGALGLIVASRLPQILHSIFEILRCAASPNSTWLRRHRSGRLLRGVRAIGHYAVLVAIALVPLTILLFAILVILFLGDWWHSLILLTYCGATLVATGAIVVVGPGRSCSHCSYPMTSWRASANRCPECGNLWKSLGGTVYGTRLRRAWLFSGIALLLAAAAIWAFVPL